ncbi:unnamed protein product [Thelazia callipaeda]|uniref:E3 ubiquitin-protein ligase n=1 Tax=Thelazia callipaeda TaxID=103827 RepID=A0A0N5D8X1_THECL|nr:unnamed protein product [Thelazia callipaeda]
MFDPVFCRMRSTSTREYNDALLRYEKIEHNLLKQSPVARSCDRLWLPYRLPAFDDIWAARSARFLITPSFLILVHKIVYIYVDCQELNESIFQATVYLLTLFVKFVTSRQFPNIVMDALTNVPLSIKEMMSKGSTVSDMLASSFTKIVITKERKMSPIIMLLLNYMRQLNDEKAITRESDRLLAEALYKKINMDAQELDSVSGYAIDYIGRLFCLLYHSCDEVRKFLDKFIVDYRMRQSKRDECNKGHDTSPINSARRLAAKRRQEILLAAHQKKNALLMKKMMEIEGMTQTEMDAMETAENSSVRRYGCSICNDTTACTLDHPVGMMCSFLINYVLEHSLSIDCLSLSVLEVDEKDIRLNPLMLKAFNSYRRSLIETLFAKDLDLVEAPAGIEVRTCGHYAHVECYKTYIRTLLEDSSPTSDPLRVQIEISCPVCRATVHTLLPDNESEKFTLYEDLFVAFLTVCDEWTSYREINASTPKNLQMFALELAKNNIERNILLSELDLYDRSNRELLTGVHILRIMKILSNFIVGRFAEHFVLCLVEHLIHGVRYQGTRRDIDFIAYQWKHITFGFSKNYGNMGVDCSRIQEIWQQSTSQESEISDSSIIEAKIAKMHMENDNKLEDEIPLVVFDLKTTLVRISAYIVTDDSLTSEDRKGLLSGISAVLVAALLAVLTSLHDFWFLLGLLSFVFQATFYASIVRTAIVAAIHMRKSQLKELKDLSLSNEVFTFAVQNVVNKILSYSCMELEDIFISNATFVDFEKALQFACTDLSRLTAQLWHECGIQKYPKDYSMTNATYMEIYRSLTDCNELSLELLPIDHINRWVGTVFQSMNRLDFLVNLCEEPLSWHRFILLQLPGNYDDLFTRFFGRTCVTCQKVPRMPFICLLCGLLLCLDNCCTLPYNEVVLSNEVERHTYVCCGGVGCFLSLNTTLIAIVSNRKAALWGSVYLDAHGEEDRNLRRGKPLFLSKRRLERLFADWAMQSFDHLIVKFFNFENLMSYLRDGHYALQ